jgi:hypothetical protein
MKQFEGGQLLFLPSFKSWPPWPSSSKQGISAPSFSVGLAGRQRLW